MIRSAPLSLQHPDHPGDNPVDVAALGDRVRKVAREIGARVRRGEVAPALAVPESADPDHHLWRNGDVWWIAFMAHAGVAQERVRFSLGTLDRGVARTRRDAFLRLFAQAEGLSISLRFSPRRAALGRPGKAKPRSARSAGPAPAASGMIMHVPDTTQDFPLPLRA